MYSPGAFVGDLSCPVQLRAHWADGDPLRLRRSSKIGDRLDVIHEARSIFQIAPEPERFLRRGIHQNVAAQLWATLRDCWRSVAATQAGVGQRSSGGCQRPAGR